MNSNKHDRELDHEYDGIREFDNPLPGWWLGTFYGTILFSLLYVGYYWFGPGKSHLEELESDMAIIEAGRAAAAAKPGGTGTVTEDSLLAVFNDPAKRAEGKRQYSEKCASCHAPDGGGLIGPNLTDRHWLHGKGSLADILKLVSDGVPEKGMPPWKSVLKPEEVQAVTAHVKSLQGSSPANPKAPQGEEAKN